MKAVAAFFVTACLTAATAAASSGGVRLSAEAVPQGGVVRITVAGEGLSDVRAGVGNRSLVFFSLGAGAHAALLGVDLQRKPGPLEITIRGRGKDHRPWERTVLVRVTEKAFPREELTVPPSFDRIDEATLQRIKRERATLARLWSLATPGRLWDGGFVRPVPGAVTSPFGLRRIINGHPRSPHSGIDLKVALGAPVVAANHGRVVLREEFFFSGKSLVLDHGGGLYTMYFHLSEFGAEMDAVVRKGEPIGLAGMSGRVTGPHLHWGARLNGARVDPLELVEIGDFRP